MGKFLRALFGIRSAKAAGLATVSAVAIYSGFTFSKRSLETLEYVNPQMQAVADCAIKRTTVDFVVYHGLRSDAEQRSMIARGVSWVNRSSHQDGDAIDVMAIDPKTKKGTWQAAPYHEIAKAFYSCGNDLNTPVIWGGEWRVQDLVHFELKRGANALSN